MAKKTKFIDIFLVLLIASSLLTKDAKAYLDPGSSSYLLQILLAGFFSVLLAVKTFWKRITLVLQQVFGSKVKKMKDEQAQSE